MAPRWLENAINDQAMWYAGYLSELYRVNKVAKGLRIPDGINGFLSICPPGNPRPSRLVLRVDGDEMGEVARALLPAVGKFAKRFDASYGTMELVAVVDGVEVVINGRPPESCTVERVVDEIDIPAEEARTEERVRYVMQGDCDPLLKPPEAEKVPEQTQPPTEEDVQHA